MTGTANSRRSRLANIVIVLDVVRELVDADIREAGLAEIVERLFASPHGSQALAALAARADRLAVPDRVHREHARSLVADPPPFERGWRVVGTVRGRAALHDLADRSAGRLEVEILDVVKPETNAVSQTADARKRITTRSRSSLTTAREFSTYAAGFGERPFLCAPAFPRV